MQGGAFPEHWVIFARSGWADTVPPRHALLSGGTHLAKSEELRREAKPALVEAATVPERVSERRPHDSACDTAPLAVRIRRLLAMSAQSVPRGGEWGDGAISL